MIDKIGIEHVKNFLNADEVTKLNVEIDEVSESYLINGVTRGATWINRNLCDINSPIINIKKTNILEIALKIFQRINKNYSKEFKLSIARIMIEKKNSHPITWHTDQAKGILRAIVYLKGGNKDDGNLSYVKESHLKQYEKDIHKINPTKEGLEDKIVSLDTEVGDLIIFDINGIHKKNIVKKERRVLFFEFHDGISDKPMSQVIFDNSKITENIRNNIDFLFPKNINSIKVSASYSETLPEDTPFKIFSFYFKSFNKLFFKKIKKKISRN